jgi:hypothetical protein
MYSFQCCYCKSVTLSYLFMHKENVTKKTPEVLKGQDSGLLQLNLIAALFFCHVQVPLLVQRLAFILS